ncbi:DUF2334 domain-containing protein [Methanothermococcus okinawensis]|uniref:Polysaccharide deacetylase n=1 Tax=Methanothermococcus okinawensis (strain DSM 14208 / JCM 11175 / IH1) TaxID=647113 RepID=F8ANX5_METOI|nr:DUF2334 domain-containing protein [Methanothermococcus okinawensis]AEH07116.1 hypothetical protein Metok_1147 [Methanothermococcus okinawensis IH1]
MKKLFSIFLIVILITLSAILPIWTVNPNFKKTTSSYDPLANISSNTHQKPIILIHDVSPVYFNELKDIEKIIDKNHYQNRTYLFVIVNHANEYNLKNYPKFTKYLHHLDNEGYHIEYHAYNHIGAEYKCNKTVASEKLNDSFKILKDCGFNTKKIKYFIPPRYKLSTDAENVFLNKNITIIMEYYILKKENNGIKRVIITNKEYTWYMPNIVVKPMILLAMLDYNLSKHQFCLSIHPKAVNYGNGLIFLDKFLNATNK